jgi:hypothetical protein
MYTNVESAGYPSLWANLIIVVLLFNHYNKLYEYKQHGVDLQRGGEGYSIMSIIEIMYLLKTKVISVGFPTCRIPGH